MTRMLSRIFNHVTGVDISEEMIRQARQNTAGLDNVDLVLGDGCTLATLPANASWERIPVPTYDVIRTARLECGREGREAGPRAGTPTRLRPPPARWRRPRGGGRGR